MSGYNTGPRVALPCRYATAALALSGCNLANTADEAYFDIPFKCNVVYAAMVVQTIIAGDAVVKFDRQHAASNATGRTDGTIATINLPDTTAIGQVIYDKAAQGSLTAAAAALLVTAATCRAGGGFWNTSTELCERKTYGYLEPGMQVVVQVVSGTTGNATPMLVVDMCEEVFGNLANATETT